MTTVSLLYYGALAVWSAFIAYTLLFSLSNARKVETPPSVAVSVPPPSSVPSVYRENTIPSRSQSVTKELLSQEGFKSFQTGPELSVEDIVKGLSRS